MFGDFFQQLAQIHIMLMDPERILVALGAIMLVSMGGLLTGALGGQSGPLFWSFIELLFGRLGGRLDRLQRSAADLMMRGFIIMVTALCMTYIIGTGLDNTADYYHQWKLLEIVALAVLLSSGTIWKALWMLHKALGSKDLVPGAYYTLAVSTRSNLANVDDYTITRVGMGHAIRSFDKALVAPVLWYCIGGLPLAYLYACLAALSWRFGKDGFSKGFGAPMMALEKLMGFVPHMFSATLLALSCVFTPTAMMSRALQGLKAYPYDQGGLPLSTIAWGLNVSLGGPTNDLEGSALQRKWAGPEGATAKLEAGHLYRVLYAVVMAHILLVASLMGAVLFAELTR